jgi:hypothetical protein
MAAGEVCSSLKPGSFSKSKRQCPAKILKILDREYHI